ncbi:hypothetical protein ACP4OV_008884 [Aristida adscensionis]
MRFSFSASIIRLDYRAGLYGPCSHADMWSTQVHVSRTQHGSGKRIRPKSVSRLGVGWGMTEEDDGIPTMTALEYIVKFKELPQCEVDLVLRFETKRTPFSDTEEFKELSADPAVTPAVIADVAAVHEARQERSIRFQEYVRSEYQAHGYVKFSDEYVARRIHIEAFSEKLWKEGFARSNGNREVMQEDEN